MENRSWIVLGILGLWGMVVSIGCVRPMPLSPPIGPIPTPTPSATGLYLIGAVTSFSNSVSVLVRMTVNGAPETTAAGKLTGPGVDIDIAYSYTAGMAHYLVPSVFGMTLQPQQDYVLTIQSSVGTASVTITAPGIPVVAPDGSMVSWSPESDEERVNVGDSQGSTYDTLGLYSDLTSAFQVPITAYPAPGNYYVIAQTRNVSNSIMGADPPSRFALIQYVNETVTR